MADAELDPVIHQTTRLKLMTYLYENRQASFSTLKGTFELTDGNLATHTERLEAAGYLERHRVPVGRSFETRFRITREGHRAFEAYVQAVKDLLPDASASEAAADE